MIEGNEYSLNQIGLLSKLGKGFHFSQRWPFFMLCPSGGIVFLWPSLDGFFDWSALSICSSTSCRVVGLRRCGQKGLGKRGKVFLVCGRVAGVRGRCSRGFGAL